MQSVIYELRANDVREEDIELILSRVKNRLCEENLDIELQRLGYSKIFTVDYDEIDEFDDYYNDFDNFEYMKRARSYELEE